MNLKKIFQGLAIGAAFMLPFSASAMSPVSDSELSAVTGQAGVSINLDANVHLEVGTAAWGDKDGLGTTEASGAGWVGVKNLVTDVRVRARQDLLATAFANIPAASAWAAAFGAATATAQATVTANLGAFITAYNAVYSTSLPFTMAGLGTAMSGVSGDPATVAGYAGIAPSFATIVANTTGANEAGYNAYVAYTVASAGFKPLTIDVATDAGAGHGVAGTTFVRIGTGSLEVAISSINVPVALGGGATPNLNQELGSLYMSGLLLRLRGDSYVDIYNGRAAGQGVTLGLNVIIDTFTISQLSWGDDDGFILTDGATTTSNTSGAGFVGLENLSIGGLTITGNVKIDVATTAVGAKEVGYATTFVRIGLDNLTLGLGAVNADVVLGDANNFAGTKYQLGALYMSATTIAMNGYADLYALYGKQGVNIDFDVDIATLNIATLSWGDIDGLTDNSHIAGGQAQAGNLLTHAATATAGYVGLKNLQIANLGLAGNVTIDVATVEVGNTSTLPVGTTFVRIGLNNINVSMTSLDAIVALGTAKDNLSQELGSMYMSTLTTDIDGGVDIFADSLTTQGVALNLNATVAAVDIAALSWGDSDGIATAANAGYVGLKNLDINNLALSGKVTINVATVTALAGLPANVNEMAYAAYATHNLSPTFVHIGIGTGDASITPSVANGQLLITIGSLAADIALDSNKQLNTAGAGALGSLYLGNVSVGVNGWVDIAAH